VTIMGKTCSKKCRYFQGKWCLNTPLSSGKNKKGEYCTRFSGR